MTHPTPYTAGVRTYMPGATTDALGNTVDGWEAPQNIPVITAAPGGMEEPGNPNRDLSRIEWTLICPPNLPVQVGERDLIVWDGVEFKVNGRPRRFDRDPWQRHIGPTVIELLRAEG